MSSAPTRDEAIQRATTRLASARKFRTSASTNWGRAFWDGEIAKHEAELREAEMMAEDLEGGEDHVSEGASL